MTVQEVMARTPICCTESEDVASAAALMIDNNAGWLAVTEHHYLPSKFIGVLTERDICHKVVADGKDSYSTTVGECMSEPAPVCAPGDTISDALARMSESGMLRLPVLNHKHELLGTISVGDIIRHQAADSAELFRALSVICMNDVPRKAPAQKAAAQKDNKKIRTAS